MVLGNRRIQVVVGSVVEVAKKSGHNLIIQGQGVYNKVGFIDWYNRTTDERFRVFEGDQIPEIISEESEEIGVLKG